MVCFVVAKRNCDKQISQHKKEVCLNICLITVLHILNHSLEFRYIDLVPLYFTVNTGEVGKY